MIPRLLRGLVVATLAAGVGLPVIAASPAPADLVLRHGAIYTLDARHPWASAIAVRGGRYVRVGRDADVAKLIGPSTTVVDLAGGMVMPGIIDAHVHALEGASERLYNCQFPSTAGPEAVAAAIRACVAARPEALWIRGGRWASGFFEEHHLTSPRTLLDDVSGDKAVILTDDSGHNAWLNSKALTLLGINAASPDPDGGRILREVGGTEPSGVLLESAAVAASTRVPAETPAEAERAVREAERLAHELGIIGLKEAYAQIELVRAYRAVDLAEGLTLYVATCLQSSATYGSAAPVDVSELSRLREELRSPHVATDFVKIFLDGVPTPARTAAMLAPYRPDDHGVVSSGLLHVDPAQLAKDVTALDRAGFTVKMHAAGDRSVRVALDAVAAARRANGPSGLRHEIAHAGFVAPADLPRFRELDVVADLSPVLWYPSPIIDAIESAVGPEARHYWPVRTLLRLGAPLAAGSDWPSVVESMDPWSGIEAFVTRADPSGRTPGRLWPEEAITLAQALRIYTLGGARALKLEKETGSIEQGKSADFILLDRNLFKIPQREIGKTRVLATYFKGQRVSAAR